MTSDSQLVVCHKCGNLWPYSGSRRRATCPSCNAKVRVEEMQVETIYDAVDQLVQRLDRQEQKLRARRETYGQMRQRVPEIEGEVDDIEDELEDLNERVRRIESHLEIANTAPEDAAYAAMRDHQKGVINQVTDEIEDIDEDELE